MLGIVSDEQFESEINELQEKKSECKILQIERGRGNGNTEVPEGLRKVISEELINGTPSKQVQEIFGVSPASCAAYKNGATSTSTYNQPNKQLESHNSSVRTRISDRATRRIMMALKEITPTKIQDAKLKDISALAKDMSAVVKNLEPANPKAGEGNNGPTYIFYTPRIRKEQEFEVIDAVVEE